MLRVTHNAGFFSCCVIRLLEIVKYYNLNKKTPEIVDSSQQFQLYKSSNNIDLTPLFFRTKNDVTVVGEDIPFTFSKDEAQFSDYRQLNFAGLQPFIDKYFTPTSSIERLIDILQDKYGLTGEYSKICGVYYRGNDKIVETNCPSYDEFITKAKSFKMEHPEVTFLLQTDELEFQQRFQQEFPGTLTIAEIQPIPKVTNKNAVMVMNPNHRSEFACLFLAAINILSRCGYFLTTSSNCAMWVCLYRRHAEGVIQYLNPKEYIYGVKNTSYDPNKNNFWLS